MDNLPDFTGHKKFIYGNVREFARGQAWTQNFWIREPRSEVFDWYVSALNGGGWQIKANNGNQVMATNSAGNQCIITVTDHKFQSYKCSLTIAYVIPKKT